jgi:hypothetical protein
LRLLRRRHQLLKQKLYLPRRLRPRKARQRKRATR